MATDVNIAGLSEHDIRTKSIAPAIVAAGWDCMTQLREEVSFTAGRIIVRGKLVTQATARAGLLEAALRDAPAPADAA